MERLHINEVKQGMVLAAPIHLQNNNQLLLKAGTRLTEGMIQKLRSYKISEVNIAGRYTLLMTPKEILKTELEQYMKASVLKIAPDVVEANTCDDMVEVSRRTRKIISEIVNQDEVLDLCVQMQIIDCDTILSHGINTAILSMLVAGAMGLSDAEMMNIGIAGLLHNLGVCEMPFLINKEQLNVQEELLWKEHCTYGYYFAIQGEVSHEIAHLILYHHEKFDGSGYPKQLKGEEIPLGARIISLCSDYNELLFQKGYKPYQAIEYIYAGNGSIYDKNVVNTFTSNIAVYPLGSMVRLSTKEIGVVVNVRENQGPRPLVQVHYNRTNKPLIKPRVIDLAMEKTVFIEETIVLI